MRVVVSLTTIPSRLGKIRPILVSLMNQTLVPDAIYLNLPEVFARTGERYLVPKDVVNLPFVTINRVDRDYGPITKLLPTLSKETDPETCIVIVDDDTQYSPQFLRQLVRASQGHPDAVICNSCGWLYSAPSNPLLPECKIVEGFAGVLFRRKFFQEDFFAYVDKAIQNRNCFQGDDYVISSYLSMKSIPIKPLGNLPQQFSYGFQSDALHQITLGKDASSFPTERYEECRMFLEDHKMTNLNSPPSPLYHFLSHYRWYICVALCLLILFLKRKYQ